MTPADRLARIRAEVERRLGVAEDATPGPWGVERFSTSLAVWRSDTEKVIARLEFHKLAGSPKALIGDPFARPYEDQAANANLIAAARTEYPRALRAILAVLERLGGTFFSAAYEPFLVDIERALGLAQEE